MTVRYEDTGNNEGVLYFTIDREDSDQAMREAYKGIKNRVNIPGFRKGKVSYEAYTKMVGEESLYQEALSKVLPKAYEKASEEVDENLAGQPRFEIEEMKPGSEWKMKAEIGVRPEVKLGDYKNLEISKQDREVSDEDVENRLKQAQENLAELSLKDGPAEEGDTVVIDFTGYKDGQAFDGGHAEDYSLELGSHSFIDGFEDQLIGAKAGDEVEVQVTFPDQYHAEDLAGEDAVFKVTVNEVKQKEVPELDDEFAKDVDEEVDTLDELKEKYRKEIQETKDDQADEAADTEALKKAVENAEIGHVPQSMIDQEVERQTEHYLNELQRQGVSPSLYYQLTGTNEEQLRQQFAQGSEDRVKTNLVLDKIVATENISATGDELNQAISGLAKDYDLTEDKVKEVVTQDMLDHDISLQKAMDLITDSAKEILEPEDDTEKNQNETAAD